MEYRLRTKHRKNVPPNYKKEWTEIETDQDIYYAYINLENQVEIRSAKTLSRCMTLAEGTARSNYGSLKLECAGGEVFLLYTCFEAIRNTFFLGAIYPFAEKREEVLYVGGRKPIYYGPVWLGNDFYVAVRQENGTIQMMQKRKNGFETVQ